MNEINNYSILWSTRREPLTMGKQLVSFITCGCESSAPFFVIYKPGQTQDIIQVNNLDYYIKNFYSLFHWFIIYHLAFH
jgi:hypothetical protein